MHRDKIIRKVPGEVSCSKKESQGYIENLKDKSDIELKDLLARQNKLLANKSFINKLPDKGAKINQFKGKIVQELDRREEINQAAMLLSRLNIATEGKKAMNELEWTGKYSEGSKVIELDSEDEEDPLKILAQPTGSGVHKKKIYTVVEEKSLINAEDLKEIESFANDQLDSQHVKYLSSFVDHKNSNVKERFMEYRTTLSNVHDPMKEKERKRSKHWEITAATPPPSVHGQVKVLDLTESLILEKVKTERLREIQAKHAIERLTQSVGMFHAGTAPVHAGPYRDTGHDTDTSESDLDHEVHDDEDNDKAGTVVFTVDSLHE